MTPAFTPTWIRWYNDETGAKVACISGAYEALAYGSASETEFHAAGKAPHPEHGQFQVGLACSRTSRTIVVDIDNPVAWKEGCTFVELGDWPDVVTSYREDSARAHIVIEVPAELLALWPKQGPTVWGDVKSNGFSYEEGVHSSGLRYISTRRPWVVASADLLKALTADRIFPQGKGATGVMAGPWQNEGYLITSHDEAVATVMSMVNYGMTDAEVTARLEVIMPNREGAWPERDDYITEKIGSARRKIEERDRKEMAFWALLSPDGTYEGLAHELNRQIQVNSAAAAPAVTAVESAEFLGRQASTGIDLTKIHLALRLNPQQRPIEPRSNTDKANAGDILEAGVNVFRFAGDEGCYLVNTGTHWATWGNKSEKNEIGRTIASAYGTFLKTPEMLAAETAAQGTAEDGSSIKVDEARNDRLLKSRNKFMNSPGQATIASALITEARMSDRYSVTVSSLDSEPDVLWAGGVPWSLRHPELARATDHRTVNPVHMKTAACAPVSGPTPVFDQVLAAVWPSTYIREWALREIAGVMLWGATSKLHPILDGPPGSGKSTFALILKQVLGSYAVQVSPDKILGGEGGSGHDEEIAAMVGARMVWMDEPPPGGKQSISRFNDLASGTGELSAAPKFQNRFTAPKLFNFLICQNPRNGLRMDAQGVSARMTLIPCHGEPEVTLAAWERWTREGEAEYPAILGLLIRECALFHTGKRHAQPNLAIEAREEAQERSDEFAGWVLENYDAMDNDTPTIDAVLDYSPTIGALRTLYNGNYARDNRLSVIGADEAREQLDRVSVRVATAGIKRRKNVVFVKAKAPSYGNSY